MRYKIALLGTAILLNLILFSQSNTSSSDTNNDVSVLEEVRFEQGTSVLPNFISFQKNHFLALSDFQTFLEERYSMSANFGFETTKDSHDNLGIRHILLKPTYLGYPYVFSTLQLNLKADNITSINGNFSGNSNAISSELVLTEKEALEIALNDFDAISYKWEFPREEQHLRTESNDPNASYFPEASLELLDGNMIKQFQGTKLCFRFNIYAQKPFGRREYFIDAANGEILFVQNLIHTQNVPGRAVTAYSDTQNIVTDSTATAFRLRETTRGNGIETYDLNNGTNYSAAVDFTQANNFWNTFNPGLDRYATDGHWGSEMTYDYFSSIHSRNSIDGAGFALKSYIHYGTNYVNAFWDGQRMTYGDGDATTSPLTSLDIAGHEIAHGLTNFTAGLIYANESGALNESFSDIFGTCVENFARPARWNWLIGEDIGSSFRSMSNPKAYGDPDTYNGTNWINQNCIPNGGNDQCGVHTNSGVQNYWFYLLSNGGNGVNDLSDAYSVTGLGIVDASKIAFRNLTVYLNASSNFAEARFYSLIAATDIFGACSPEVESVTNAWHAVGVGGRYITGVISDFNSGLDSNFCTTPVQVSFNNKSNNGQDFFWDFGNGATSTLASPSVVYTTAGVYDVRLVVNGGTCGADSLTKTAYINVNPTANCALQLSGNVYSSDCIGSFYDDGGYFENYGLGISTSVLTINPFSADQIILKLNDFDVEAGNGNSCNRDYVQVYDGLIATENFVGRYCNSNPPPDSIISTANIMSVVFYSDRKVTKRGFSGQWYCRSSSAAPANLDFGSNVNLSCDGYLEFYPTATNGVQTWNWDFGNGQTSTEKVGKLTYKNSGIYSVSLTASNSAGTTTIQKVNQVTINRPNNPIVSSDSICIGADAKLFASTNAGSLRWFRDSIGGTIFYQGDTLRLNNRSRPDTFYVETVVAQATSTITPLFISGNGGYSDSTASLIFDVLQPLKLKSLVLNSNRAGNRVINVFNKDGKLIHSKSLYVGSTPGQVFPDFTIYPDSNYRITVDGRDPGLYMNTSGVTYPYEVQNLISIKTSSLGTSVFPFFYYFTVEPISCRSPRVPVTLFIDSSCIITGVNEQPLGFNEIKVFPNPTSDNLTVELENLSSSVSLRLLDLNGRLVYSTDLIQSSASKTIIDMSGYAKGMYILSLEGASVKLNRKIVKIN